MSSFTRYNPNNGQDFNFDPKADWAQIGDDDIQGDQDDTIALVDSLRVSLKQNSEARNE